jgi:hypothetical protein
LLVLAKREEAQIVTDEHHAVNTMIDQGAAFDQIEEYIDTLALPGEQLSALWLLVWAEAADPATRRQVVEATLASAHWPPFSGRARGGRSS